MRTQLITREGYNKLKQELDYLWREERPEVTKKVTWAASLGDRSENADYQYNKKRLREIDRRVRYLTKCLEQLKIVDYSPQQEGKVFFGAWVEVENDDGDTKRFRIVGYDEIFGRKDYISIDAPMARALLKKRSATPLPSTRRSAKRCGTSIRLNTLNKFQPIPNLASRQCRPALPAQRPCRTGPARWHFSPAVRITVPCLLTVPNRYQTYE
ncbi:hypothetical protein GGER_49760 [Serratia rubidaea]